MAEPTQYQRDKDGQRFLPGGINTVLPLDKLPPNKYAFLQNVRAYRAEELVGRATESDPISESSAASATLAAGAVSTTGSGATWTNPSNILSTTLFATVAIGVSHPMTSQILEVQNAGISIPFGATVTGIGYSFQLSHGGGTGLGVTAKIQPMMGSSLVGTTQSFLAPSSPTIYNAGGMSSLFDVVWTPSNVPNLGFSIVASIAGSLNSSTVSVNSLEITVYYTVPMPIETGTPVHSLAILNDTTPLGPPGGFVRIIGSGLVVWVNATAVASGFSGNPLSLNPFRPNASVRPWMYVWDSSLFVVLASNDFQCTGSVKIQSDSLIYKTGVKEPQVAPTVSTGDTTTSESGITLAATALPWTIAQESGFNYGQTNALDGTAPVIISVTPGASLTINVVGSATVNGSLQSPGATGSNGATFPGQYVQTPGTGVIPGPTAIVLGAFIESDGITICPIGVLPNAIPNIASVGSSVTLTVPENAATFQVGIDSSANTFNSNSGSFTLMWTQVVSSVATALSILGQLTAYYWGDSPISGPVASYIWKNPEDPSGSGPSRSISNAVGSTNNNSFIFDATFVGGVPQRPGIGDPSVPMQWTTLNPNGSVEGSVPVFTPDIKGVDGNTAYQNFNFCVTGSIFVPQAGVYTFMLTNHDDVIWGIGGATLISATSTFNGGATTPAISSSGQTITVVSSLPLLPRGPYNSGSGGNYSTATVIVSFPAQGTYPIEIDYDYWFHSGRILLLQASATPGSAPSVIVPLPASVRQQVQYRYVYRSSATGALSNPSPESAQQTVPVLSNVITPTFSDDPQVDKVDYYRLDSDLESFTYTVTGPNTNPPTSVTDSLSDLDIATNPLLQFDNYEPFPVIDLPKKGVVNVSGGVISWVSGDQFNVRWLPGTIILIGSPTSIAYVFIARPTSATSVTIPGVPDGANLAYEIPEPDLAAQPLPYVWGPTQNAEYYFGVGDPYNPGTLYFSKGNNPDSAPQTNQIPVTSPSEILQNGCITAGVGMVFSTERRWLIYPTFTTALATVSGVSGTAFNLILASSDRGLYIPTCLATDGAATTFFRAKDGVYLTVFGGGDVLLTGDIYNLFPREGVIPQPVTIAGNTIFPPDDTQPLKQKLSWGQSVLFYDYLNVNGDPCTLVYDFIAQGWSVDVGEVPFTSHAWEQGPETDTVMVGCQDGTVRLLGSGNPEVATSVVIPGAQNGGDARAFKRVGDIFIKAIAQASNPIEVALYANRYAQALTGFAPTSLVGTGALLPYIIDFSDGFGDELIDVGIVLSWPTGSADLLDLWSPTFTFFPEATQDRPTSWEDCGTAGNKFIQGLLLEANSFGKPKAIQVQRSDDFAVFTPNESPVTFTNQSIKALTFTPPFLAHQVRIITTDGVLWRHGPDLGWRCNWSYQPFPESTVEWATELTALGGIGWQHLRLMNLEYISMAPILLSFVVDTGNGSIAPVSITIPSSGGTQTKTKLTMSANKWKLISFKASSTAPMNLFLEGLECWVKSWGSAGEYRKLKPFGGQSSPAAEL